MPVRCKTDGMMRQADERVNLSEVEWFQLKKGQEGPATCLESEARRTRHRSPPASCACARCLNRRRMREVRVGGEGGRSVGLATGLCSMGTHAHGR